MRPARGVATMTALRCAAWILVASVLAACAGGCAGHQRTGQRRGPGGRGGVTRVYVGLPGGGAVLVGSGFGGSGFGGSGSGGRPRISVSRIPPPNSTRPIAMPLDNYEQLAGQQQAILAEAGTLLIQRCMAARGFVYTAQAQTSDSLAPIQQIENRTLGLTSMTQAETYGYGQPKDGTGTGNPTVLGFVVTGSAFGGAVGKHGRAWANALERPGPRTHQGCLEEAQSQLYGSGGGDPVPGLIFQAVQWTQTDPRNVAVSQAWSRCMAHRGYSYATPLAAALHRWPKLPSRTEIATAVADQSCKAQTNMVHTWQSVQAAYQQALIDQNLTQLAQLQSDFGSVLRRAETLIAASG